MKIYLKTICVGETEPKPLNTAAVIKKNDLQNDKIWKGIMKLPEFVN